MRCRSMILTLLMLLVLGVGSSFAQTPVAPGSRLAWDINGPSLAEVQAYTFKSYRDASTTGVTLTGVTCEVAATSTMFTCITNFPADTPGAPHTIAVSASNAAGESLKSTPLAYQFFVIPADPRNLRVV
jgi:hypothetical protein